MPRLSWNPVYTRFWLCELPDLERHLMVSMRTSEALAHDIQCTIDLDDLSIRGQYLNFWMVGRIFLLNDVGSPRYIQYKRLGVIHHFEEHVERFLESHFRGAMCISTLETALLQLQTERQSMGLLDDRSACVAIAVLSHAFSRAGLWADKQLTNFATHSPTDETLFGNFIDLIASSVEPRNHA